jgi:hypothetical protein
MLLNMQGEAKLILKVKSFVALILHASNTHTDTCMCKKTHRALPKISALSPKKMEFHRHPPKQVKLAGQLQ